MDMDMERDRVVFLVLYYIAKSLLANCYQFRHYHIIRNKMHDLQLQLQHFILIFMYFLPIDEKVSVVNLAELAIKNDTDVISWSASSKSPQTPKVDQNKNYVHISNNFCEKTSVLNTLTYCTCHRKFW